MCMEKRKCGLLRYPENTEIKGLISAKGLEM